MRLILAIATVAASLAGCANSQAAWTFENRAAAVELLHIQVKGKGSAWVRFQSAPVPGDEHIVRMRKLGSFEDKRCEYTSGFVKNAGGNKEYQCLSKPRKSSDSSAKCNVQIEVTIADLGDIGVIKVETEFGDVDVEVDKTALGQNFHLRGENVHFFNDAASAPDAIEAIAASRIFMEATNVYDLQLRAADAMTIYNKLEYSRDCPGRLSPCKSKQRLYAPSSNGNVDVFVSLPDDMAYYADVNPKVRVIEEEGPKRIQSFEDAKFSLLIKPANSGKVSGTAKIGHGLPINVKDADLPHYDKARATHVYLSFATVLASVAICIFV
eukprot:Selendium_serpulae@DN5294_c0_g1_i5.p1